MNEHVIHFGKSKELVGILTDRSYNDDLNLPAIVILNSGLIHRVGPNRLTVRIARSLSNMGFCSFRFDFSGIGDSLVSTDAKSMHERWITETHAAMDVVTEKTGNDRFILMGNCSGAAFSFLASRTDDRVVGAVLINLQGPKKLIRYYFKLAFTNFKLWMRIINISAQYNDFFKNFSSLFKKNPGDIKKESYSESDFYRDLKSMINRKMKFLFVYSEWDPGLPYFRVHVARELKKIDLDRKSQTEIIPGINHDFNLMSGQEELIIIIKRWISKNFSGNGQV